MAITWKALSFFLIISLNLLLNSQAQEQSSSSNHLLLNKILINNIEKVLKEKGYSHVAEMLKGDSYKNNIPHLVIPELGVKKNTSYTIFAPIDDAFHGYPSISLMQYHVPFAVTKEMLESRSMFGQKIDTLVRGHPIVVTTGVTEGWIGLITTINNVNVIDFNVYNDGKFIIHGTEYFFDPDYQTVLYPWFTGISPTASHSGAQSPVCSLISIFLVSVVLFLSFFHSA